MAAHPHVQVCWDIMHPVTHGQSMSEAFEYVKEHVLHCHIHDGKIDADGSVELCPTGEGDIPHDEAVQLLSTIDFVGVLSGEWISSFAPEEILPQNADMLRRYIEQAKG